MEDNTNPTAGEESAGSAGRFDRAKEFMNDKYDTASQSMRNGFISVREKVDEVDMGEVVDHVRGYVRSHPGKALLLSVGVGFLVGLLLRSDDNED